MDDEFESAVTVFMDELGLPRPLAVALASTGMTSIEELAYISTR